MSFKPMTAREALLEIRRRIARFPGRRFELDGLDEVARLGLDNSATPDFELTDQLADRLAKAIKALREMPGWEVDEATSNLVAEALTLPPDIEAMVERRIGPS